MSVRGDVAAARDVARTPEERLARALSAIKQMERAFRAAYWVSESVCCCPKVLCACAEALQDVLSDCAGGAKLAPYPRFISDEVDLNDLKKIPSKGDQS